MSDTKRYLGDGVYLDIENDMFKLTTENGISTTNTIYLEVQVYYELVRYVDKLLSAHEELQV